MPSQSIVILVTVMVYMAVMVLIGLRFSKKNNSVGDFYLGGRKLGPLVTAMSAEASDMSSWLLMGLPGVALAGAIGARVGYIEAVWTALGLAVGTYLNFLFVAKRLRRYSEKLGANTIPDYFSERFGETSGLLTLIVALIIIIFFVPYTASGFSGVGKLFNSLFGIDYHVAMIIGAIIICLYTTLGGFLAASTTDFIQSIIMTVALFTIVGFCVSDSGSLSASLEAAKSVDGYFNWTGADGGYGALPIASTLAWGLGYFGMPHILLRFMAIKDDNKLKISRRIASVWVVISMAVAIFIGVIGVAFVRSHGLVESLGADFDAERIIIYIADEFSRKNILLAVIAGLIVSGIMASIMSTADSQMLAASSSMSENIIKRFFWKKMSNKSSMILARITVVIITVVAIFFAWNPKSSVFRIVSFAWAGFGATFGPVMLLSLFWKRCNKYGATAGLIAGGIMVFLWKFVIAKLGGVFAIYELLPAFIINLIVCVAVSLLTPKPEDKIIRTFEEIKNM
ncbi:MAG: sodium/proline symporter [Clostridia bacterium]|nr:sodium/proline symporter [Clostridia bacterium]